jgi:hypothetical protein
MDVFLRRIRMLRKNALITALWLLFSTIAQGQPVDRIDSSPTNSDLQLFRNVPIGADIPDSIQETANTLRKEPDVTQVTIWQLREQAEALQLLRGASLNQINGSQRRPISISVTPNRTISAVGRLIDLGNGLTGWLGEVQAISNSTDQPSGIVDLIISRDGVRGNISLPTGAYQVEPIGSNFVAISEIDTKNSPDHPPPSLRF